MKSHATCIAIRESPRSRAVIVVIARRHDILEEQRNEMYRMRIGTEASIVSTNRVGHMGFVVRAVKILPIPARREKCLCSHTIWTLVVEEVRTFSPVRIVGMIIIVVYQRN